jgi:alpha-beta hydrolase superfamily lysophospholipase
VPVLVLHGGADRMVPPDGSRQFVASASQSSVRMIEYPGAYHALLADLGGSRVLADLAAWLEQHL